MKFSFLLAALLAGFSLTSSSAAPKPLRVLLFAGGCCHDYAVQHLILKEGVVSRHHARIVEMDGHYLLQNWESRNGTILNGEAVQSCEVKAGDTITFGLSGPQAAVEIIES